MLPEKLEGANPTQALRKELEAGKGDALAYDDKLVRDFIEKIEVFPEMMRFTMRTGMVTEVEM